LQVTKKLERDLDKRQRGIESATEDKMDHLDLLDLSARGRMIRVIDYESDGNSFREESLPRDKPFVYLRLSEHNHFLTFFERYFSDESHSY